VGALQETAVGAVEGVARMWALSVLKGIFVVPENLMRWFGRLPGQETERCSSHSEGKGSEMSSSSSSERYSSSDSFDCSNCRGSLISESLSSCLADWRSVAVEVDVRAGL
jgi:hypothetical protein